MPALIAACVCAPFVRAADLPARMALAEDWRVQSSKVVDARDEEISAAGFDVSGWHPTRVPRTVLAALADNGVYPDPYYGLNLKQVPGYRDGMLLVVPKDSPFRGAWWYRTEFTPPADWQGRFVTLHLDGINLRADVWLNGARIASEKDVVGMFRRFTFPVRERLRFGKANVLALKVAGPGQLEERDYDTKQVEATTGWDDHNPWPPDLNAGVWEDVYLEAHGPLSLAHPYVETDLDLPALDAARLTASVFVTNHAQEEIYGELKLVIEDRVVLAEVALGPGETREVVLTPGENPALNLAQPRIWWPVNLGSQELYGAQFTVKVNGAVSDSADVTFGVREVNTFLNDEDWRTYEINGRRVLIRGCAWMTADMLLRLTPERYEALVRYASEAGLNMLRSEGFSIRETDEFYNLCDRYGVMVTQQIFGRNLPDEALALACIDDMMLRVRPHPSLVHFLGHDETYPTDHLDEGYQALIEKYRLHRTYQPHSGTFYVPERARTGGTRTGTRELWTYVSPEHYYRRTFDGAWGFAQSGGIGGIVAHEDSIRAMMPEDQLWPALDTEAWSFHSVVQGGEYFDAFRESMNASYGAPANLLDFLRKAYAMNYSSARGMFEAYGRNKYKATGITTWKYDAAWPAAITWQYVDWYLRPTAAYFGAKKACEPLHAQFAYDDRGVWVVNTHGRPYSGVTVTATVRNFDLVPVFEKEAVVAVEADGKTQAFVIPGPEGFSDVHFLTLELRDASGALVSDNFYWLSTVPDIPGSSGHNLKGLFWTKPKSRAVFTRLNELPPATLQAAWRVTAEGGTTAGHATIENTGPVLAFLVQLDALAGEGGPSIAPAYWSDNYFSLLPGERREVTMRIPTAAAGPKACFLRLSGWNVAASAVNGSE